MSVFPRRYGKSRSNTQVAAIALEAHVRYMEEQIEHYASQTNKKILALNEKIDKLKEENVKLNEKSDKQEEIIDTLQTELEEQKEIIEEVLASPQPDFGP